MTSILSFQRVLYPIISIEIGLTLIGPFDYPSLDESKPVSPILKLYVQDKPDFQFLKPVEVMLPQYLNLTSEDNSHNLGVEFLRADMQWTQTKCTSLADRVQ